MKIKPIITAISVLIICLALIVLIAGDSIWPSLFRFVNGDQVSHLGLRVDLPENWWVKDKEPESIYLIRTKDEKIETDMAVSISRKNYDINNDNIVSMSNKFCGSFNGKNSELSPLNKKDSVSYICVIDTDKFVLYSFYANENIVMTTGEVYSSDRQKLENIYTELVSSIFTK